MKKTVFMLAFLLSTHLVFTQNQAITKEQIAAAEKLIDLEMNESERDSMLLEISDNLLSIKAVHGQHLDNWVAPALIFDPIPSDFKPRNGSNLAKNDWQIPNNISLPTNKSDLAFYNIKQLASLIKNKKITSVDLTKFFIERLKKYGNTLHCVISI